MSAQWAGLAFALSAAACVPSYRPPTVDQPHAAVKFRRTYETIAGTTLVEAVEIDEHSALDRSAASSVARTPLIDAILVHPIASTFVFQATFSHMETRLVHEAYQVPHTTYRHESYDCGSGFGASKTHRTCSRSVPHTHYETRYRDVWKQVQVTDAACSAGVHFSPQRERVYLLQYTYHDRSVCSLSCMEQIGLGRGKFTNRPCATTPFAPQ